MPRANTVPDQAFGWADEREICMEIGRVSRCYGAPLIGMERSSPSLTGFLIERRLPEANQGLFQMSTRTGFLRDISPETDACTAAQARAHTGLLVTRQVGLAIVLAFPAPISRLCFSDVEKDGLLELFWAIHHEIDGRPLMGAFGPAPEAQR